MSTPKEALTTPTTKGNIRSADSYVFSSPARDVGWSPGAANTPLGVLFCDNVPKSAHVNHIIESNLSPIHRLSRFPLSDTNRGTFSTSAPPHRSPTVEFTKGLDFTSNELGSYEPSKEARASGCLPPPSSPQPFRTLFHSPLSRYPTAPYLEYSYGENKINHNEDRSLSGENSSQLKVGRPDEPAGGPLKCFSSPISAPCYNISDSPVKPRRVPMFPPPASPPLFAGYHPSSPHAHKGLGTENMAGLVQRRAKRTSRSALLSPSSCYPSAEPLDDDPFLVRPVNPTEDRLPGGNTTESRPGYLDPLEFVGAMSSSKVPAGEMLHSHSTDVENLFKRPRNPRGRSDTLGNRVRGAKAPTSRSRAAPRKLRGAFAAESNPASMLPPSASSPSFSLPYRSDKLELVPQYRSGTTPLGYTPNDDYMDPFTQSTQSYISPHMSSRSSHPIPATVARTLFPTPSLTSSLDTPSTGSILPTPIHSTLFPSPDITSSPTMMRSSRGRGRVARGKLVPRYATLTPMSEPDLIGGSELPELASDHQSARYGSELPELASDHQSARYTGVDTWSNHVAHLHDPGFDRGGRKEHMQTTRRPEGSVAKGTNSRADEDLHQDLNSSLSVNPPSTPLVPLIEGEEPQSSPVNSTPEDHIESLAPDQVPCPTTVESLVNDGRQSKRGREEDDNCIPVTRKRVKLDESDTSASATKARGPKEIASPDLNPLTTTRAVSALLALSASGDNSVPDQDQTSGIEEEENLQNQVPETETPITRRRSNRFKYQVQSVSETSYQTPGKRQKGKKSTKQSVVGRAPSRVVHTPSRGAIETRSNASAHAGASSGRAKRKLGRDSQQAESSQVSDGETEPGNVDQNQEADHVLNPAGKLPVPSELLPRPDTSVVYGSDGNILRRTFPEKLPIHESYPQWYRRNPVSAYFMDDDPAKEFVLGKGQVKKRSTRYPNPVGFPTKLRISTSMSLVSCMARVPARGDCVQSVWNLCGVEEKVETSYSTPRYISQYNYHMQYYHGISPKTGLPFSPPIAFRHHARKPSQIKSQERKVVEEGKCHVCKKWVPIETVKLADVPELYWWKHASCCHRIDRLAGDKSPYIEDNVYFKLREYEALHGESTETTQELFEGQVLGSPKPDEEGVGLEDDSGSVAQEGLVDGDHQEPLTDSDSDLTDLDMEAEVADTHTSDDAA
ncbi:unnamed protein product [Rhizoctonia solani]|uniref:Transcription regulator Rua1 C-terminal domain-containing protein n=1 Tax=Rhizoctonia solani TaxID=456999 RepID=A0A8H3GXE8_9AGAM|nr:unnamed protein product [Rhizoctonia solani]